MIRTILSDPIEKAILIRVCKLREENFLLNRWVRYGDENPTCAVCGKPIKSLSTLRRLRPYRWDCRECYTYKPTKIINLEMQFGMDIVEILKQTSRQYGKVRSQCEALGLSIPHLYATIRKYCGDSLEFLVHNTTGERHAEYLEKWKERREKISRGKKKQPG